MSTTSAVFDWPIPESTDSPNGPAQIAALVAAIEDTLRAELQPPGTIRPTVKAAADPGWLLCNGASHPKADYPDLDAVLSGMSYPWGSSETHFNVPDLRGRSIFGVDQGVGRVSANNAIGQAGGAEAVTLTAAQSGLRDHTHAAGGYTSAAHSHGDGTLSVASHTHGPGTYAAANHSHGPGTFEAAAHSHADGTLSVASHTHEAGSLGAASHTHGPGSLYAAGHSHEAGSLTAAYHQHGIYLNTGEPSHGATLREGTGSTSYAAASAAHVHLVSGSTDGQTPDVSGNTADSGSLGIGGQAAYSGAVDVSGDTAASAPDVAGNTASSGPHAVSGASGASGAAVGGESAATAPDVAGSTASSGPHTVSGNSANPNAPTADGTGASASHPNMPPYAVAYFQIRT